MENKQLAEKELVDIIASGYEWICPKCAYINKEIEYQSEVQCGHCDNEFETSLPEHAIASH